MSGWIGVDLDGTLAHYDGWKGIDHIGPPVPAMVAKVHDAIVKGFNVKIFTARVCVEDEIIIETIREWCIKHVGHDLEVTNIKDFGMIELWDDRAKQVVPNTGRFNDE